MSLMKKYIRPRKLITMRQGIMQLGAKEAAQATATYTNG